MPMMNKNKKTLLRLLIVTYAKGVDAELELRLQKAPSAKKVHTRNGKLRDQINILRAKIANEWVGSAKKLEAEMRSTNRELQAAIRDIERSIKVAQRVVKVIGYLDKVIEMPAKLLL